MKPEVFNNAPSLSPVVSRLSRPRNVRLPLSASNTLPVNTRLGTAGLPPLPKEEARTIRTLARTFLTPLVNRLAGDYPHETVRMTRRRDSLFGLTESKPIHAKPGSQTIPST